ncbi:MAG: hypothetical protein HOW97_07520, partial [Catenulispora sp.]|nr:hypothetical protein [Catenulispora sp.]
MPLIKRTAARVAVGVLAAAAVAVSGPVAAQPAMADTPPVTGSLTITPSTTVVGGTVTVVATATNNTTSTQEVSLGIDNPQYAAQQITAVSGSPCSPRNLHSLIYCGDYLAPGATMSIKVTLTPTAAGTDNFRSYA